MTASLPKSAPFSTDEIDTLNRVVGRATALQRNWLSGFLAGIDAANGTVGQLAAPPRAKETLTILYGSETGNAEALALKARKAAQKLGFDARLLDMADANPDQLVKLKNVIVIVATWGEGDPPQRAANFIKLLTTVAAPRLDGVRFAVLALGDTAYVNFCATGRTVDDRLAELGAIRIADRFDLDLDFAKQAATWTEATLTAFAPADHAPTTATVVRVDFKTGAHIEDHGEPAFDAENPLSAEIREVVNLNGSGSSNETWHVEFSTDAAGWSYAPGDAIGVIPQNDPDLVAALLETVGLGGDAVLQRKLLTERDVTTLTRPVVNAYAQLTGRTDVAALGAVDKFATYAANRQIIDLLGEHREQLTAQQLVGFLRPLPPRLYSVASSPAAHHGETHLLVGAVRWNSHGRGRKGVASTWLAKRSLGDAVKLYVKPNRHFRLPTNPARPIIMIGAGTGIAPFRAFIEERTTSGAKGKSWLFFGARNYMTDFLYQLEWQDHLASGALTNIDLAFSRDQPEKVYVQHRLAARAEALRGWVKDGATIYVCGDEKAMARDVDIALTKILGEQALEDLRSSNRYLRDVY